MGDIDDDGDDGDDGWTVATGKKSHGALSRMRKRGPPPPGHHAKGSAQSIVTEKTISKALENVATSLETLRGHPYAANVLGNLPKHVARTKNYWVWGLGSLDNPSQAQLVRYQASMALLLIDRLPELAGPPETVDPAFTPLDLAVFERLGFATQTGNHDWNVHEPTLIFAPHLEQVFTTRLLRTTQESGTLTNLTYIGNSISKCLERNHVRMAHSSDDIAFLESVAATTMTEISLRELGFGAVCPGAFNDLAVHCWF